MRACTCPRDRQGVPAPGRLAGSHLCEAKNPACDGAGFRPRRKQNGSDALARSVEPMKKRQGVTAFLFLAPYLIIFVVFRLVPSFASIFISFTKWSMVGSPEFVGLQNYWALFKDASFFKTLTNNMTFLLVILPSLIILSLFLAIALNSNIRGRNGVRVISIVPYVLIPAVVGIMWNWLYEANFGVLNYLLEAVGLRPVGWLIDKRFALISVSIVIIWSYLGYNMILYLAGLQGVNREVYEAAQIDGANGRQIFARITWPLLLPTTSLITTLTIINVMQVYDQVVVMTGGGPSMSTMTLIQYQYIAGFERFQLGYGSTIGVATLALLLVLVNVQRFFFRSSTESEGV